MNCCTTNRYFCKYLAVTSNSAVHKTMFLFFVFFFNIYSMSLVFSCSLFSFILSWELQTCWQCSVSKKHIVSGLIITCEYTLLLHTVWGIVRLASASAPFSEAAISDCFICACFIWGLTPNRGFPDTRCFFVKHPRLCCETRQQSSVIQRMWTPCHHMFTDHKGFSGDVNRTSTQTGRLSY